MKLQHSICLTAALLMMTPVCPTWAGESAANPKGTWKVIYLREGKAEAYEPTLQLKLEGEKLTGTLTRNTGSKIENLSIEQGNLKGNEISFVTRFYAQVYKAGVLQPASTNFMSHWKFQGTLNGDTIKGTIEKESNAGHRTQNWEAKRDTK
jgi:hypothetical protein